MTVFFVAAEAAPIAKVGGLGDVAGSLPKALAKLGVDVKIVIPKYGVTNTQKFQLKLAFENLKVPFGQNFEDFKVWRTFLPKTEDNRGVEVFLIEHPLLSSDGVYLAPAATVTDDAEVKRFAFFSAAVTKFLNDKFENVDIIHCHDWHTGIIPDLIAAKYGANSNVGKAATVLTIHNLGTAYQGVANPTILQLLDLASGSLPQIAKDLESGDINFLQQGIETANVLNTVSPQYVKEIQTEEFGGELAPVLKRRSNVLYGILNGIDYEIFNPGTDPSLVANYNISNWRLGKSKNKQVLTSKLGILGNLFLIGMVTRLDEQKGLNLVLTALSEIKKLGAGVVILGKGDPQLEAGLGKFCKDNSGTAACTFEFSIQLASEIYAAADSFLMPSRFEPCGLGQMIAQRFGTIPVVRDVGGLHDTVEDGVTGFKFAEFKTEALINAVTRAIKAFQNQNIWENMVDAAMKKDFSWDKSAAEYVKLYERAIVLKSKI